MSFTHSQRSRVLLDDAHLSGYLTEAGEEWSGDVEESTTLLDSAKAYVAGLGDGTASLNGFFDGSADAVHDVFSALKGSNAAVPYSYAPAGFTAGSPVALAELHQVAYNVGSSVSGIVEAQMSGQATGGVHSGVALADLVERAASGEGTQVDGGAGTADGAVAHLHVTAVDGEVTVKVEHSEDGTNWADLVTFAAAAGTVGVSETLSGTVHRYVRASWTLSGTSTFAVAFARL